MKAIISALFCGAFVLGAVLGSAAERRYTRLNHVCGKCIYFG
jgi:hypothetical protein